MAASAYYIPSGPKNLSTLLGLSDAFWRDVSDYHIQVKSTVGDVMATTPQFILDQPCENDLVIHFVNFDGANDSIKVHVNMVEHDTSADRYVRPLAYPLDVTRPGSNRINLNANDIYTVTALIDIDQFDWIKELFDSPFVWIEYNGTGTGYTYLPIDVQDAKVPNDPSDYENQVQFQFQLSNDNIPIRS